MCLSMYHHFSMFEHYIPYSECPAVEIQGALFHKHHSFCTECKQDLEGVCFIYNPNTGEVSCTKCGAKKRRVCCSCSVLITETEVVSFAVLFYH